MSNSEQGVLIDKVTAENVSLLQRVDELATDNDKLFDSLNKLTAENFKQIDRIIILEKRNKTGLQSLVIAANREEEQEIASVQPNMASPATQQVPAVSTTTPTPTHVPAPPAETTPTHNLPAAAALVTPLVQDQNTTGSAATHDDELSATELSAVPNMTDIYIGMVAPQHSVAAVKHHLQKYTEMDAGSIVVKEIKTTYLTTRISILLKMR